MRSQWKLLIAKFKKNKELGLSLLAIILIFGIFQNCGVKVAGSGADLTQPTISANTNLSGSISSFYPYQGYATQSPTISFYGQNFTSNDVITIGGTICAPVFSQISRSIYTCVLPALCPSVNGCTVTGNLPVFYTQNSVSENAGYYSIMGVGNNSNINTNNLLSFIGVHSHASQSIDLSGRALSFQGNQILYFQFAQPLCVGTICGAGAISSVMIGNSNQMPCTSIQADPRGGNYYQCTTHAFQGLPALTSAQRQMITFQFSDGTVSMINNAVEIIPKDWPTVERAAKYCSNNFPCASNTSQNPIQYQDGNPALWNNYVLTIFRSLGNI